MFKKILLTIVVLVLLIVPLIGIFSRRAPDLLREALSRSLEKEVRIGEILYRFPSTFEIRKFEVREKGKFAGEISFSAAHMSLTVSPLGLSEKRLIVKQIEVRGAEVTIWNARGHLIHALSEATKPGVEVTAESSAALVADPATSAFPLEIRQFRIVDGRLRLIDLDIDEKGFVFAFEGIHADIRDIALPLGSDLTTYRVRAALSQGRDQKAAELDLSGKTRFQSLETQATLGLTGTYVPYYKPYYSKVTPAEITSGTLDTRLVLSIVKKDLKADIDLSTTGLLFGAYESDGELFGLKADEILSLLEDSGRLRLQIAVEWNLDDRNANPREAIRRGIERSLKATVLGNVGNILRRALKKYGDTGSDKPGASSGKDKLGDAIGKVKDFFDSR